MSTENKTLPNPNREQLLERLQGLKERVEYLRDSRWSDRYMLKDTISLLVDTIQIMPEIVRLK